MPEGLHKREWIVHPSVVRLLADYTAPSSVVRSPPAGAQQAVGGVAGRGLGGYQGRGVGVGKKGVDKERN